VCERERERERERARERARVCVCVNTHTQPHTQHEAHKLAVSAKASPAKKAALKKLAAKGDEGKPASPRYVNGQKKMSIYTQEHGYLRQGQAPAPPPRVRV
jgi:methylmalonyl-CoA mutase N-terminal domain/subunit